MEHESLPCRMYRVTLSYACYGIAVCAGRVVDTPPIAKWMEGKTFAEVEQWVKNKGGTVRLNGSGNSR